MCAVAVGCFGGEEVGSRRRSQPALALAEKRKNLPQPRRRLHSAPRLPLTEHEEASAKHLRANQAHPRDSHQRLGRSQCPKAVV